MTRFLRDMIAIPSESCEEKGVAHRIAEEMKKLGYDKVEFDALGNVIGWMGSGDKIIAIDSHIDTVGIGNRENWTHDPYEGYEDDKVIYGRGGSDQEGGMAAAAYGTKIMKDLGLIPEGYKIMVVGSVQEEDCDGMCWQSIVNEYFNGPEDARSKIEFVISKCLDALTDGTLSDADTGCFADLKRSLLEPEADGVADRYFVLGDFQTRIKRFIGSIKIACLR